MKNTIVSERILQVIDYIGISKNAFAQNIGYERSQALYDIINNKAKPSYDFFDRFVNSEYSENINTDWLITGKGEMLKDVSLKQYNEPQFSISQFKQRGYAPYYSDLPLSAGQMGLTNIEQRENPESWIKLPNVDADGWFPVIGCSMEPKIFAGDIVGVKQIDNWERIDPDKTYMIITRDDRMIKHLETDDNDNSILWAISENYKQFKIVKDDIIRIFRVVWAGRFV
jgi:phage repressor protein C with HTH and peptisase S24 domain